MEASFKNPLTAWVSFNAAFTMPGTTEVASAKAENYGLRYITTRGSDVATITET